MRESVGLIEVSRDCYNCDRGTTAIGWKWGLNMTCGKEALFKRKGGGGAVPGFGSV